jgi:hypothetical protein
MKRTHEKERVAALSAGLAVIVLAWIAVQAFASDWIDSIGVLSVWLYGPISAAAWGVLSAISYVLIIRAQRRNPALCPEHEEATREARSAATGDLTKVPKCIEDADILELEKDKLAALMGGFAITIAGWLAVLSFAPPNGWTAYRRGFTVSRRCWFGGVQRSLRTGASVAAASRIRRLPTRTDPGWRDSHLSHSSVWLQLFGFQATSNSPATPMPPPRHMVMTTYLTLRRLLSIKACPTTLEPLIP